MVRPGRDPGSNPARGRALVDVASGGDPARARVPEVIEANLQARQAPRP